MSKLSQLLKGSPRKQEQIQIYTPEQQQFMSDLLQRSQPGLGSGMDRLTQLLEGGEGAYDAFEAPMMRQYEEQVIPGLAERFSGLNAQSSSAFGQALGQAGAGLTENLASLRENIRSQALGQLTNLGQLGLGQRFENLGIARDPGLLGAMAPGIGKGIGEGITGYLPQIGSAVGTAFGPIGSAVGGGLGAIASKIFSRG